MYLFIWEVKCLEEKADTGIKKNVISSKFYQILQGMKYMEYIYIYGTDNQYNVKKFNNQINQFQHFKAKYRLSQKETNAVPKKWI